MPLRGRSDIMSAIDAALLRTATHDGTRALLVAGETGSGKTATLRAARVRAERLNFRTFFGRPGPTLEGLLRPLVASARDSAAAKPLAVFIDDVHRADELAQQLIGDAVGRLAGTPVLWVFSASDDTDWAADQRFLLTPLSPDDLLDMARDRLGASVPDALRRMLADIDGHPGLASRLIEAWQLARAAGEPIDQIPSAFVAEIRDQFAALPTGPATGLRLIATLGGTIAADAVCSLVGVSRDRGVLMSGLLTRAGILATRDYQLTYRHELVRQVVYAEVSPHLRRILHRRCAEYLLSTSESLLPIVEHIRAGAEPGDEHSAGLLLRAGEEASGKHPQTAARLASEALALLGTASPAWPTTALRALRLFALGEDTATTLRIADQALAQLDAPDQVAQAELHACTALILDDRPDEALGRIDGRPTVVESPVAHIRLEAARALARTSLAAADDTEDLVKQSQSLGDLTSLTAALRAAGAAALRSGHYGLALTHFRRVRQSDRTAAQAGEIHSLQMLDRHRDAEVLLTDAQAQITEFLPSLLHAEARQAHQLGRLDESDEHATALIAAVSKTGNRLLEAEAIMMRAEIALARGQTARARELLRPLAVTSVPQRSQLTLLRGLLAEADGSLQQARELLEPLLEPGLDCEWPWQPESPHTVARIGFAIGDKDLIRKAVTMAEAATARNPGVPSFAGVALHLRGLIEEDVTLLELATRKLAHSPRVLLRAAAAADHARLLIRTGERTLGLTSLQAAWELYRNAGATAGMAEVERFMRGAGVRQRSAHKRPVSATGLDALTPAERRVAELIGAGHTNRSAARLLGVSINTVGTHLNSIYAKLGVRSRVQLANTLLESDLPESSPVR